MLNSLSIQGRNQTKLILLFSFTYCLVSQIAPCSCHFSFPTNPLSHSWKASPEPPLCTWSPSQSSLPGLLPLLPKALLVLPVTFMSRAGVRGQHFPGLPPDLLSSQPACFPQTSPPTSLPFCSFLTGPWGAVARAHLILSFPSAKPP